MTQRINTFKETVYQHYERAGRKTLPWRLNTEAWGVLLSEFMLQQTQVERVISYWERWLSLWPTPVSLSRAPLEAALREWNGLGYNRRCLSLWESARRIETEFGGTVPATPEKLITLTGIGAYSAGAIACFAYNHPSVFIETNIRAAALSYFFEGQQDVKDDEIAAILGEALDRENPRLWYWALMDYGAAVKKAADNPNRRSAHYSRQSRFEGSFRQSRGEVLRVLLRDGPANADTLRNTTGIESALLYRAAESLRRDLLVSCRDGVYMIAER